jgi:hypothetical protein
MGMSNIGQKRLLSCRSRRMRAPPQWPATGACGDAHGALRGRRARFVLRTLTLGKHIMIDLI